MTKKTRTKVPSNVDRVTCNGEVKYQRINEQIEQLKKVRDAAPDETTNINLRGTCLRIESGEIHAFYGDKNHYAVNSATVSDLKDIRLLADIDTIIEQHEEIIAKDARIAELECTLKCAVTVFHEYEMSVDDYPTQKHKDFISVVKSALDKGDL